MEPTELRRWWMTCSLLVGVALLGGCAMVWNAWDMPSGCDAVEGGEVWRFVVASGTVPENASVGRRETGSRRLLYVVGVEDPATQNEILRASAEARRLHSTKPVVVIFSAGVVVKDRSGGARFPDGTRELRRETIP